MWTTITDGKRQYRVYVRSTELKASASLSGPDPLRTGNWLDWFRQRGEQCRMPCPPFTAEDYGIAAHLLKKYGWEGLKNLAMFFWLQHSDPLRDGYSHPMRLFAAKIPEIEVMLK